MLRNKLREIIKTLTAIPAAVVIDGETAKRVQVNLLQLGGGEIKTTNANGVIYAWKEK